ncbi:Xylose isomerase [Glycine soja]|uniref:xylose isomerase n=1 Tax=Glycine soja TaxID=3848 RepID=A0A0B2RSN2_GLYSO|nr:Xylose isomerase [Glycine soja]
MANKQMIGAPQTCAANDADKCGDSDEWEGEFFPGIPKIKYEGPSSKSPLSFKWYNAEEEILGKKMKRCILAYKQVLSADPFGAPTKYWPWEDGTNSLKMAKRRMRANFEFISKLGVDFWCFHDRDIAPDGKTLEASQYLSFFTYLQFLDRIKV